ncbi:MAG: hypothetical protein HPY45_02625 [Anaerolineae bacterium]|nr:hypothetical protein [Anaerolineae bacterium]
MTDNDNSSYDYDSEADDLEPRSSGGSSRTFIIAFAILAVVFLVFLAAMVILLPMLRSSSNAQYLQQAAQINAQNTATSLAATQIALTMDAQRKITPTPLPTTPPPPSPVPPTSTPVVLVATESAEAKGMEATPEATAGVGAAEEGGVNRTATIAALFTQAAMSSGAEATTYPFSSTALPNTGFMDEFGLPGMIGVAIVLVAVVIFARRLRTQR